jgi:hypothetical protein
MSLQPLMTSTSEHWCTPAVVLDLVRKFNGGQIGLDPCSNEGSIVDARIAWTSGGLEEEWDGHGLVYCNPPYGRSLEYWTSKMSTEARVRVEIIALLPARTDTAWFDSVWTAQALRFWRGRLKFLGASSSAPFPSCLAYWGPRVFRFADVFEKRGHVVLGMGR